MTEDKEQQLLRFAQLMGSYTPLPLSRLQPLRRAVILFVGHCFTPDPYKRKE